jgi:hypothetical protein
MLACSRITSFQNAGKPNNQGLLDSNLEGPFWQGFWNRRRRGSAAFRVITIFAAGNRRGADLFPATIASVSGSCPQHAQNVQGPSDSFLLFPTVGWRL